MNNEEKSIALGTFDGLHRGHLEVIRKAKETGYEPYVLLFSEHPLSCITGEAPPELLTERIQEELLKKLGVEKLEIDFRQIMHMPPEDFFYEILLEKYHAKALSCGENYTFGDEGKGDVALLSKLCKENNIRLSIAPLVRDGDLIISSTEIRKAIQNGDIERANHMLGRPFSYDFEVVSGDGRGKHLGFPTINQVFSNGFIEPKYGVYASMVECGGKAFAAVTNFGERPTIGTKNVRSETCILNFSGDLYGKHVKVQLLSYLRPEIKFNSLEELSKQIDADSKKARELLETVEH